VIVVLAPEQNNRREHLEQITVRPRRFASWACAACSTRSGASSPIRSTRCRRCCSGRRSSGISSEIAAATLCGPAAFGCSTLVAVLVAAGTATAVAGITSGNLDRGRNGGITGTPYLLHRYPELPHDARMARLGCIVAAGIAVTPHPLPVSHPSLFMPGIRNCSVGALGRRAGFFGRRR
jgi:hypothetical protein